jgi:hypothetical protein
MVGIVLTLLAVILVICLAFCYTGPKTFIHEDQMLWQKGRKPAAKKKTSGIWP